jgi:hypothetical protein
VTDDDAVLEQVLRKLEGVVRQGGYWKARCPVPDHDDRKASLSVARGTEQPVVFKCHAGCDQEVIREALGLSWADLSADNGRPREDDWTPCGPAIRTYLYTDGDGKLLFGVCRTAGKQFPQWQPDAAKPAGRAWTTKGVKLVPYRLPRVLAAVEAGSSTRP